jgi:hypothetical protein
MLLMARISAGTSSPNLLHTQETGVLPFVLAEAARAHLRKSEAIVGETPRPTYPLPIVET